MLFKKNKSKLALYASTKISVVELPLTSPMSTGSDLSLRQYFGGAWPKGQGLTIGFLSFWPRGSILWRVGRYFGGSADIFENVTEDVKCAGAVP